MPFQDLLNNLGQRITDNLSQSNKLIDDNGQYMMDRAVMSNPNKAGPPLPPQMPEEQQYGDMMANGMMGSVAPAGKFLRALPLSEGEQAAKSALNTLVETGANMPMVQKSQQALSREADFAKRAAMQRFEALRQKLGR